MKFFKISRRVLSVIQVQSSPRNQEESISDWNKVRLEIRVKIHLGIGTEIRLSNSEIK